MSTKNLMQDDVDERSDWAGVLMLMRFARDRRRVLVRALLLILASSASVVLAAYLLGRMVDVLRNGADLPTVARFVGAVLFLEFGSVFMRYRGRMTMHFVTTQVAYSIRQQLFQKLLRLPMSYFDKQAMGRTITRLTNDVEGIEDFFGRTLANMVIAAITIVVVFVAMLLTSLQFGMLVALSALPAVLFSLSLRGPIRYWMRMMKRHNAQANSLVAEFLSGIRVLKAFALEHWTYRQLQRVVDAYYQSSVRVMGWNTIIRPITVFLCAIPTFVILWKGSEAVLAGSLSAGVLIAFVRYAERFLSPIMTVSQEIQQLQEALSSSERVAAMLLEPDESDSLGVDGSVVAPIRGAVSFQNVSMHYDVERPVLKDVSFEVLPGEKVALVGRTGSGKTTTVNLLPCLYAFQQGSIIIDDIPLSQWRRAALRRQIGYVSQDVTIFRGTLRQNLLATADGAIEISDAQILQACQRTRFSEVLARMPRGLDTVLIEGGSNLSMGERQLLSFTRILLKDPAIIILDEATASVDHQYEQHIQQALAAIFADRTCFIVAHRLSTVQHCDKILVFRGGQLVEQGTHGSMWAARGPYYELVQRQAQGDLALDL